MQLSFPQKLRTLFFHLGVNQKLFNFLQEFRFEKKSVLTIAFEFDHQQKTKIADTIDLSLL